MKQAVAQTIQWTDITLSDQLGVVTTVQGALDVCASINLEAVSTEELTAELMRRTGLGKELE